MVILRLRVVYAATLPLLLVGCADFAQPLNGGSSALPQEEIRLQALETKLVDVSRKVDNLNLASQSRDNIRLGDEMRGLRGDVEGLRYLIESSSKRNQELYVDMDKRIQALESSGRSTRLSIENQLSLPSGAQTASTPEEEATYLKVFDLLKSNKYDEAITGFQEMLSKWPEGRYADNAHYWMGESYYAKKDFSAALQSFRAVLDQYPGSPKAADALFKSGLAHQQLGQTDVARATLQKVIDNHPGSSAAALARSRLEQLKTP
ncbi:MAG: tol-pal system protein YbgF [Pseudomonadota bacterium]